MAERGPQTLRFGPMKPVGLTDPRTGRRPHAVVQLRQDNALGTLYNMVGFQTKLKHAEQVRVFRLIPGLERAEFARLGGLHRNTFVNSPRLLDLTLRMKAAPHVRLAGQITGCEGYVESAAVGLLAGRFAAAEALAQAPVPPPPETAHGALLAHITGGAVGRDLPADERQFRPVPAAARRARPRASASRRMARRALEALTRLGISRRRATSPLAMRAKIASSVATTAYAGPACPEPQDVVVVPRSDKARVAALPQYAPNAEWSGGNSRRCKDIARGPSGTVPGPRLAADGAVACGCCRRTTRISSRSWSTRSRTRPISSATRPWCSTWVRSPASRRLDLALLAEHLRQHRLMPVGIQNGTPEWNEAAIAAGLAIFGAGSPPRQAVETPPAGRTTPVAVAAAAPRGRPARVITEPVRGGQQIVADGDLVVTAPVSAGAELAASGHIHVYGTLRGRAFAGIEGDEAALIFCDQLEAELLSIAGVHLVSEGIDPKHQRRRARVELEGERLVIHALS